MWRISRKNSTFSAAFGRIFGIWESPDLLSYLQSLCQ